MSTPTAVANQEPDEALDPSRRRLLAILGLGSVAAAGAGGALGFLRFFFPTVSYEPSKQFKVGAPTDYQEGQFRYFNDRRLFVVKKAEGWQAISAICQHLGCTVNWQSDTKKFFCGCHGSIYDELGKVERPPAPRPLEHYEVGLSPDGQVVVDFGKPAEPDKYFKV